MRVSITNTDTRGASAGYGEGKTHAEAIADALRIARQMDSAAEYDRQSGAVLIRGGVNC